MLKSFLLFCGHIFGLFSFIRLNNVEEFTRATIKKLTQGMDENNKSMAGAKTDEEKEKIVSSCSMFFLSCLSLIMTYYAYIFTLFCRKLKSRMLQLGCGLAITF